MLDDWTLSYLLTGHLHGMLTVHDGVMMTSSVSGSGTWVGSAHSGEEDVCDAWRASVHVASHPAGA